MQDKTKIFNKAFQLQLSGNVKEAQELYLQLVEDNIKNDKLLFLLGTTYLQTNEHDKAINYLDRSIDLNPNFQDAYNNRGIALAKIGKFQESVKDYDSAINLKKDYFDAHLNKGISLRNIEQKNKAIECFKTCIALNPKDPKIYNNLGNVYKDLKNFKEAINFYSKAIQVNKNYAEAYYNRGNLLLLLNHAELAISDYEKAIKLKDNFDFIYGYLIHAKMRVCDWRDFADLKKRIEKEITKNNNATTPFEILSLTDDQNQHRLVSENYSKYLFKYLAKRPKINWTNNKKIKIGYFSGDFRNHPTLHLILDIIKKHDNSKFQIFGFYHGPKEDEYTREIKKYFYQFFNVSDLTSENIANLSRENNIDIAIDLSGYIKHAIHETYYYRAAPIQINYLGYPGTMGNELHDYIIVDKNIIPDKEFKNFSEKVIYLPNCYQPNQNKVKISKKHFTKKDFNLPEGYTILGCLSSNYKINPSIFNCWMDILNKCKKSILWVLKESEIMEANLLKEAHKRGIDKNRILFAKKTSGDIHLKRLKFIDLYLDTYPYGAHTTGSEVIRMGVPLITMMGKSFASRVASSILINVGLDELVTKSFAEYTETAIDLVNNKNKINDLKNHLKNSKNVNRLFDSEKFTKDLENIFLNLLKKQT